MGFFVYVFFPPDPSPYRRQTLITFSRHQKNILGDFRTHSVEVLKLLHPPSFPLLSWKPTFGPRLPPAAVYNEASPANAVHLHADIGNPKNTFSVLPFTLKNEGLLIRVFFYGIISPTVFLPPPLFYATRNCGFGGGVGTARYTQKLCNRKEGPMIVLLRPTRRISQE